MKTILLPGSLAAAFALAPTGTTQTTITPQKYYRSEAPAAAYYLGGYPGVRMQFAESYLTGLGAKSIKQVGYRLDYRHSSSIGSGLGKSWTNVSLHICNTSEKRMSSTFTKNQLSTPTLVFSSAVAWPTFSGYPSSRPAPFAKTHRFPFKQSWAYVGNYDVLLDYVFEGGALANGRAWGRTEIWQSHVFDSPPSQSAELLDYQSYSSQSTSRRCTDARLTNYAYVTPTITVFAKNSGTAFDDKVVAAITSSYTAPARPVVHAMSVGAGSTTGTVFPGIACNNLYVTPATMFLFQATANNSGSATTDLGQGPWSSTYSGLTLWFQAAWDDSSTNYTKLSMGTRVLMPTTQTPDPLPRSCVYNTAATRVTGLGPYRFDQMNPMIEWTH